MFTSMLRTLQLLSDATVSPRYECFKQEKSISLFTIALLLIFSVSVTLVYLQWKEPVFHQVMYGALVACLVIRSIFIVTWVYPWLRPLCYTSLGVFMLGFLLWNIDNIFCDTLRTSRQRLPSGVGVVTQFHAWWHIFTGLGSYLHILLSFFVEFGPRCTLIHRRRVELKEYLRHFYGYKPKSERQKRTADSDVNADWVTGLCDGVQKMQRFFGLPPTGELTNDTLAVMKRPRCGLSDVEPFGGTIRWKKLSLSYRIARYNLPVPKSKVHNIFRAAWKLWSNVTPMKFRKRGRKETDIVISFHTGDHEDGSPFDGTGGILAHAFLPGFGIGGDVHFDADEAWSFNSTGFNLFAVAVHEFGHALGLSHSSDPGAIMYPAYNFVPNYEIQLSFKDVKDIQYLYGLVHFFKGNIHYRFDPSSKHVVSISPTNDLLECKKNDDNKILTERR
ncbi:Interstitial collagenase [Liparis tanakae]|uniref:ceramidase n=1 Tax=Liparis tanakae TaxID=230148 RepID=A0A4Z2H9F6_9TELE|nr:Interstitial collagenase [Liparis tanakae]